MCAASRFELPGTGPTRREPPIQAGTCAEVMIQNDMLTVARTIAEVRDLVRGWRARGLSVGLVPTMGWLHAGHLALIDQARTRHDRVLATIFVNPLQFGPSEDFAAYPRDHARDFRLLGEQRVDAVFAPAVSEMFPEGSGSLADATTRISVARLGDVLCGAARAGHFEGVATIVMRLLMIALPDAAYFGEKDYQQLTIIRRFVRDLDVPVEIVGVPTVREHDGLALSSRNVYLTAAQRMVAPALQRVLRELRVQLTASPADSDALIAAGRERLLRAGFTAVDYLTLASGDTLESLDVLAPRARVFAAVWLGKTRLIDNLAIETSATGRRQ